MPSLKRISPLLSPELLHTLCAMGHGDEIVIVDANFPAYSVAKANNNILIDMAGHQLIPVVEAIMQLFPLDQYVTHPVAVMARTPQDEEKKLPTPIWDEFISVVAAAERRGNDTPTVNMEFVERNAFYQRAKQAYAVITTGDRQQYACFILKKGIISAQYAYAS